MGKDYMNELDGFGLTEKEKEMDLHSYNHALFRNMMFFMDIVWEINILTGTVVILVDKNEPDKNSTQFLYKAVYRDYMIDRIDQGEQAVFEQYMSPDNLKELKEEVFFNVRLHLRNGKWELHRIVLTPSFDENGRLSCVYLGGRNLQAEVSRELAEYHNQEQFRDALISGSYFHFNFDVSGDGLINEDFLTRNGIPLVREIAEMELPVPFDTFIQKWFEKCEPKFDKKHGSEIFTLDYLKQAFERNERLIDMEAKQKAPDGDTTADYLQIVIVLRQSISDKHICASVIWRDIGAFHRAAIEKNRELKHTISQEQQLRQAVLSGSLLVYNINLTRDQIEEEFYEMVDGEQYPMLQMMGLTAPCSFNDFARRWGEQKVLEGSRESFLGMYNREYMLDAYNRGERQLEMEFDTVLGRGLQITIRNTVLLLEDKKSGDILATVSGKDITDQKREEVRQQEALKEAYEVANRASAAKSDFLTRISHDIRTPMNAIIGMAAIAEKHQDNVDRVADCLKRIAFSSKYLLALLDEMLDMSMIESGKMRLQEEEIDLVELYENLAIILGGQVREKGHEYITSIIHVEHRKILGDRKRINQIIMNLVDNAVKYTLEEGRIRVTLEEKPTNKLDIGCYEIVVEDTGIGMSQETIQHVFEPFVRAKDRRVEKIPGSGLGLAITSNIVKMLNGIIQVESEPEAGTKVTVRIFLKLQEKRDISLAKLTADAEAEEKTPIEALTERDFSGHRVLMVEDNESNANIIQEILEMVGLKVDHVWNGKEAVEIIAAAKDWYYGVVFMDIQMPVMDGYEATKAIRQLNSKYAREVPILAMSANAFAEDVQASLAAGMNEHIAKPVDFRKLGESLEKWLPKNPLSEDH